jgi:hypothetical protein
VPGGDEAADPDRAARERSRAAGRSRRVRRTPPHVQDGPNAVARAPLRRPCSRRAGSAQSARTGTGEISTGGTGEISTGADNGRRWHRRAGMLAERALGARRSRRARPTPAHVQEAPLVFFAGARAHASPARRKCGARERRRGAFSRRRADAPVGEGAGGTEAADPDRAACAAPSSPRLASATSSRSGRAGDQTFTSRPPGSRARARGAARALRRHPRSWRVLPAPAAVGICDGAAGADRAAGADAGVQVRARGDDLGRRRKRESCRRDLRRRAEVSPRLISLLPCPNGWAETICFLPSFSRVCRDLVIAAQLAQSLQRPRQAWCVRDWRQPQL